MEESYYDYRKYRGKNKKYSVNKDLLKKEGYLRDFRLYMK